MSQPGPGDLEYAFYKAQLDELVNYWMTEGAVCTYSNVYCALSNATCSGYDLIEKGCSTGPTGTCTSRCDYTPDQIAQLRAAWIDRIENLDIQRRFYEDDLVAERETPIAGTCRVGWELTGPTGAQECARTQATIDTLLAIWKKANGYTYISCYWNYTSDYQLGSYCACLQALNNQQFLVQEWITQEDEWQACNRTHFNYLVALDKWTQDYNRAVLGEQDRLALDIKLSECFKYELDNTPPNAFKCLCNDLGIYCNCTANECADWVPVRLGALTCAKPGVSTDYEQGRMAQCVRSDQKAASDLATFKTNYLIDNPLPTDDCTPYDQPNAPVVQITCCTQFFSNISANSVSFDFLTQKCRAFLVDSIANINYEVYCPTGPSGPTGNTGNTGNTGTTSQFLWWPIALVVAILGIGILVAAIYWATKRPAATEAEAESEVTEFSNALNQAYFIP